MNFLSTLAGIAMLAGLPSHAHTTAANPAVVELLEYQIESFVENASRRDAHLEKRILSYASDFRWAEHPLWEGTSYTTANMATVSFDALTVEGHGRGSERYFVVSGFFDLSYRQIFDIPQTRLVDGPVRPDMTRLDALSSGQGGDTDSEREVLNDYFEAWPEASRRVVRSDEQEHEQITLLTTGFDLALKDRFEVEHFMHVLETYLRVSGCRPD